MAKSNKRAVTTVTTVTQTPDLDLTVKTVTATVSRPKTVPDISW